MKMEKKDYLIIIGLFFIAFIIRVSGGSNISLYADEWIYWIKTNRILASNFVPRADVFDYSPPFIEYISAVVTLVFDGNLSVLRMISVFFGSLTVPVLYLFGMAMYDRKTGLLSALFLCFSAYHILYSRIIMLEALTLFFITAFLCFFWLSQDFNNRKNTTYSIVAGALLGLAIDAKWISLFLLPVILTYILWVSRFKLKALMDKKLFIIFIFAFLFFLPLLLSLYYTGVGLSGLMHYIDGKFEKQAGVSFRVSDFPVSELFIRGTKNISGILGYGIDLIISPLLTDILFVLFVLVLFSYFRGFLTKEKRTSFLMIPFFYLFILVLGSAANKHYLLYIFPFYYVMLSHIILMSIREVKKVNSKKNILNFFIILSALLMLFSYIITGITSSSWDQGDFHPWVKSALDYIEKDIIKNRYGGDILIGTFTPIVETVSYPVYLKGLNVSTTTVFKKGGKFSKERLDVDLEKINKKAPIYLIVPKRDYDYYLIGDIKKEIFKDYDMAFHIQTYPVEAFILKRKNMQSPESEFLKNGINGSIYPDLFKNSLPDMMAIGKTYTGLVEVRNTGNTRLNYSINVHSDEFILFVDDGFRRETLDIGSSSVFKFKIVPFQEYRGKLPITVDLYAEYVENKKWKEHKVDTVSDFVYHIET